MILLTTLTVGAEILLPAAAAMAAAIVWLAKAWRSDNESKHKELLAITRSSIKAQVDSTAAQRKQTEVVEELVRWLRDQEAPDE